MKKLAKFIVYTPENLVLVALRDAHTRTDPDKWHFPTGKLHEGETGEEGFLREIQEELGLQPKEYELFYEGELLERYYFMYMVPFTGTPADIRLGEGRGFAFVTLKEAALLDGNKGLEATLPLIKKYFESH